MTFDQDLPFIFLPLIFCHSYFVLFRENDGSVSETNPDDHGARQLQVFST